MSTRQSLRRRLRTLEEHLRREQPGLVDLMPLFRRVDRLLYRTGLLDPGEALAARIPWWPMISVLGTFSAGKSSFINSHLGVDLQSTGNQAVDDKFTIICHGDATDYRVLPGTALNADPRFPFFRISDEIEKVAPGEGKRIDAYLQLKTVASPLSRGVILIDSPGFDSDDQRRSTLRITDHIIDLSDLVLIFFDARHPEPGAMQDTLQHLVSKTVRRADPTKFLYVLNQIDTTAREDNAADVVGAWQRAIAQAGLVTGRFYAIYNEAAAVDIESPDLKARYAAKRDHDLREILGRIEEIGVGRSYRVVAMLETVVNELEGEVIPALRAHLSRWRRRVLTVDLIWAAAILVGLGAALTLIGEGGPLRAVDWLTGSPTEVLPSPVPSSPTPPGPVTGDLETATPGADPIPQAMAWFDAATAWAASVLSGAGQTGSAVALRAVAVLFGLWLAFQVGHQAARSVFAARLAPTVPETVGTTGLRVRDAFRRNTGFWTRVYRRDPVGWSAGAVRRLESVRETAMGMVQRLNDQYTDPSGRRAKSHALSSTAASASSGGGSAESALGRVSPGMSAFAAPPPDPLAVPEPEAARPGSGGPDSPAAGPDSATDEASPTGDRRRWFRKS